MRPKKSPLRYFIRGLVGVLALGGVTIFWSFQERGTTNSWTFDDPSASGPEMESRRFLDKTILPKFELNEQRLDEAVSILNRAILDQVDRPEGLLIAIVPEPDPKYYRRVLIPTPLGPDEPPDRKMKRSVSLTDIPLMDAIKYATALFDARFEIRAHSVRIRDLREGTFDPLVTKELQLSSQIAKKLKLPSSDPGGPVDVRTQLSNIYYEAYMYFYEDCFADYEPKSKRLHIRTTAKQLDRLDMVLRQIPTRTQELRIWIRYHLHDRWTEPFPFYRQNPFLDLRPDPIPSFLNRAPTP